jgi:hypothetical protein
VREVILMDRQLLQWTRTWLDSLGLSHENGIADLLLVALVAFVIGVIITGHRIVVQ